MPSGENLFGFSEGRKDEVDIAESHSGTHEDSLAEDFSRSNEEIENKLTGYSDETEEESRYIPDIDDQPGDPEHTPDSNNENHASCEHQEDNHSEDDHTDDSDDLESAISLVLLEEVHHEVQFNPTNDSEISAGQIEALENFSKLCRTEGIEVMKMNRRGKWQTRFLTVSSEMLNLERSGSLSKYPKALLWVKRFNSQHTYSLDAISSEGRGGVEFVDIESTIVETSENQASKLGGKFKNSFQLNLHYTCGESSRTVALRFKTKEDADYFAASIETIVDVLDHEGVY
jgi:hypothetical protein